MSDIDKKLKEMAQLTLLSHRISAIQEKNLKLFPFVFFHGTQTVEIEYDLGHGIDEKKKEVHHSSYVHYNLTIDEKEPNHHMNKRFMALERSVRKIFWNDVAIKVTINGNKVFESEYV